VFTAGEVFRATFIRAPELRTKPPRGDIVAAAFNEALLELVLDVIDIDEERLAGRYTVPSWVVSQDPVDLTLAGDQDNPTTREWLRILYVDWKDAAGEGDEVWITTIEARNRAAHDYDGVVVATASDQLRKLHKVSGWEGVHTLEVYGVLAPVPVTEETLDTEIYDYPSVLRSALTWELLVHLAMHQGIADGRIALWEQRRAEARERLAGNARGHLVNRIEDQPLTYEW